MVQILQMGISKAQAFVLVRSFLSFLCYDVSTVHDELELYSSVVGTAESDAFFTLRVFIITMSLVGRPVFVQAVLETSQEMGIVL